MKSSRFLLPLLLLTLLLGTTGCFRVSSDTRALRDAALGADFETADEKIEFGVGFLTMSFARMATSFVELPIEARTALNALKNAECAVYEVKGRRDSLASILAQADKAMEQRGCERMVGVIQDRQLVAVYVPRVERAGPYLQASVLVLDGRQLVCVSAEADVRDLMQLAMTHVDFDGLRGEL
jgi:hypothetical protein